MIGRFLGFLLLVLVGGGCCSVKAEEQKLQSDIDSLLLPYKERARVGVAVLCGDSVFAGYALDDMFPLSSVFKFPLAMAVLDSMRFAGDSLDKKIVVSKDEILENTWSPMRDSMPDSDIEISLDGLLRYALVQSDNNAADALLSRFGGCGQVMKYLHDIGVDSTEIRIMYNEQQMHEDNLLAYENCATPLASARLAVMLLTKDILDEDARSWLLARMSECQTGQKRLPKYLEDKVKLMGHKTGTGFVDSKGRVTGTNDVAFMVTSSGQVWGIAVYVTDATMTFSEVEELIALIGKSVYNRFL
ncbi:MAG: class A beta-lactamase [Paramuribaculum sp.]|nr:class A beta-lactamase [Paramuribaculum sp.]